MLAPQLAGRRLVAAEPTLQHFGALVSKLGGPREKDRWARLRLLITVVPVVGHSPRAAAAADADAAAGVDQHPAAASAAAEAAAAAGAAAASQPPGAAAAPAPEPADGSAAPAAAAQQAGAEAGGGNGAAPGSVLQQRSPASGGGWRVDWAIEALRSASSSLHSDSMLQSGAALQQAAAVAGFSSNGSSGSGRLELPSDSLAALHVSAASGSCGRAGTSDGSHGNCSNTPASPPLAALAAVDVAASRPAPVQHLRADVKTVLAVGDAAMVSILPLLLLVAPQRTKGTHEPCTAAHPAS